MESSPLASVLKTQIRASGPISVAAFMESCLYHPLYGYYTQGLNFLTNPPRDFLTAPDHTPLFGATLANWVAKQWKQLGSPSPFTLAEAGPGRGALMLHTLTHLQAAHPAAFKAAKPVLIETSPALTELQRQTLTAFPCTWLTGPQQLPAEPPIILLGNEILDAFPTHQYERNGDTWQETHVSLDKDDQLTFTLLPTGLPPSVAEGSPLTHLEYSPAQHTFLAELKRLSATALLVDYGYTNPAQPHLTLQAVHRHRKVSPLHLPGETDLTTHVNFHAVAATLGPAHCQVQDLAPFLLGHGLPELGLQHPSQQPRLQRLLHPAQMGTLFKVLCFTPSTR